MQNVVHQTRAALTHGERISVEAGPLRMRLFTKELEGTNPKLSKSERARLTEFVSQCDALCTHNGVNFSRLNSPSVRHHILMGGAIEFETLGPYLESYRSHNGVMTRNNLIAEDAIGLELAMVFRRFFPNGRLLSLYDDYNAHSPGINITSSDSGIGNFSDQLKETFRNSLVTLYKSTGVLTENAVENVDYLMVSESSKIADAEKLVARLEAKGYIRRRNEEIIFVNSLAENPLHHRIHLRSAKGKWLCEALDAATFLNVENFQVLHIVALPDYMKNQQDKVWEILRVLGISPYQYHNIFYSLDYTPAEIAKTVTDEFNQFL